MGRKSKYETHIQPHLADIKEWVTECSEKQIAQKLGVGLTTFAKYKNENEELREALTEGKTQLVKELKDELKRKARGFYYEETKTVEELGEDGLMHVVKRETYRKYAQPDTGAAHLLLKNLDETWHNDDVQTMEIKRRQVELTERKIEQNEYV